MATKIGEEEFDDYQLIESKKPCCKLEPLTRRILPASEYDEAVGNDYLGSGCFHWHIKKPERRLEKDRKIKYLIRSYPEENAFVLVDQLEYCKYNLEKALEILEERYAEARERAANNPQK